MAETATRRAADLMRDAFDALAAKDLDRLAEVWDEDTVDDFLALNQQVRGEQALRAIFAEMFTALPDMQFAVEAVHDVSDTVAVGQWRMQGTFSGGPFQGIDPTGRRVDIRGIDVMAFVDGVLRQNTVYYDGLTFARQIGMLPSQGGGTDRAMTSIFNATTTIRNAITTRRK